MKREKAERLDAILENLVANKFLTKKELEGELGETLIYRDLLTIRSHIYNNDKVVVTKLIGNNRGYQLTPAGAAFVEDRGFVDLYKAEKREKVFSITSLVLNIVTTLIALTAIAISVIQMNSQNSQVSNLEQRINKIEMLNK